MTDTLAIFADQVTTVAREVGVEGKLGGQANVPGAAGTWKDLTDNVNQLAANLTTQVRAIAEVATAVTKGDLTRSIQVEAGRGGGAQGQHQRDDPQPPGDHPEEHRAGLAEDQPRQVHPHAAGPARPARRSAEADPVRAGAAGRRAARRVLPDGRREDGAARPASCSRSYAYKERKSLADTFHARRGPGRAVRAGEAAYPAHRRARRLRPDQLRAGRGARR